MRLRTRLLSLAAVPALLAGLGLATAGAASASTNDNGTTIYANTAQCGGAPVGDTQPVEGFVNFHLAGTDLQAIVHLKGAEPNTTYYLYQYGGFCTYENYLGSVVTNSNGVANLNADVTVPAGTTTVFMYGFGDSQSIESLTTS
jgi:hypothetical protein